MRVTREGDGAALGARGEGNAALVQFPGQAQNTTQKIVLCALGAKRGDAPNGVEAEVICQKF
jgi:hypothetical protein